MVNAMRFTLTEPTVPVPSSTLTKFFLALQDTDLKVRRGALLTLNCAAHHRPSATREQLTELLPMLYRETTKKPELVHQVDLGPFKHTVDDGLELRKAAFECMDTLLDNCGERLELSSFISHLVSGLSDDHDIKLLCHLMLCKLAGSNSLNTAVVVSSLDTLVDPLRDTVKASLKDNAVKQQIERHDELVRSAMRAIRSLEKMSGADASLKFEEYLRNLKSGKHADKYAAVCAEDAAKGADDA